MTGGDPTPLVVNGWTLFAHPLFIDQLDDLICQVELLKLRDPAAYVHKNPAKRLAAIAKLVFEVIPRDPGADEFRQGGTLGVRHTHWRRAVFYQQYRLFFRYHAPSKTIALGWLSDEDTKRAYGSKADAYLVFRRMLERGHPPDDWTELLQECRADWPAIFSETAKRP
jgi:toxin YhaV